MPPGHPDGQQGKLRIGVIRTVAGPASLLQIGGILKHRQPFEVRGQLVDLRRPFPACIASRSASVPAMRRRYSPGARSRRLAARAEQGIEVARGFRPHPCKTASKFVWSLGLRIGQV